MAVNVTSTQRSLYTMRNEGKSDSELQLYLLQIVQKIQSVPPGALPQMRVQMEELAAEAAVCKEILDGRAASRSRLEKAHKEWEQQLSNRRNAAIQLLKNAVTPNGQLIAAILEDEGGLSAEELATWCDELAALDSTDFHALLLALESEGVLKVQNGKYFVNRICTETLFPEKPAEWAIQQIGNANLDEETKVMLRFMEKLGHAVCVEDFPDILKNHAFASAIKEMRYPQEIRAEKANRIREYLQKFYMAESILYDLKGDKVLTAVSVNGYYMFYFPMLGEKETG